VVIDLHADETDAPSAGVGSGSGGLY